MLSNVGPDGALSAAPEEAKTGLHLQASESERDSGWVERRYLPSRPMLRTVEELITYAAGPVLDSGDAAGDNICPHGNYILLGGMLFTQDFISFSQP